MTNKKIKFGNVQNNMRAKVYWDISERNICAAWLALLSFGVSKSKILQIDEDFHNSTVAAWRQDVKDEVLDVKINRFMQSVGLTHKSIYPVILRNAERLREAFPTESAYLIALHSLTTDFIMMLYELNSELGYGHTRLMRVIDFIARYNGDEKKEVEKELHIFYPPQDEIPDASFLFEKPKPAKIDPEIIRTLQAHRA
jgi:hypothetical protein